MTTRKTSPATPSTNQLLTTPQLQQLLLQAQKGRTAALASLCHYFLPLIKKEAHWGPVYGTLGEDAENVAWEYLLQLLLSYQGKDFTHLPGYIKLKLHYHLLHLVRKQLHKQHQEQDLELLPPRENKEAALVNSLELEQLLHKLSRQDKRLVQLLCQKHSQKEIAAQLHCSSRTIQRRIHQLRLTFQELAS